MRLNLKLMTDVNREAAKCTMLELNASVMRDFEGGVSVTRRKKGGREREEEMGN